MVWTMYPCRLANYHPVLATGLNQFLTQVVRERTEEELDPCPWPVANQSQVGLWRLDPPYISGASLSADSRKRKTRCLQIVKPAVQHCLCCVRRHIPITGESLLEAVRLIDSSHLHASPSTTTRGGALCVGPEDRPATRRDTAYDRIQRM